ncbi:MAG: zinc ribbon domain-containing protein [Luteolibacter sp.]
MAEVSALKKHPCPECGGDAEWNPAKQALVCPYCGTTVPWTEGQDSFGATIVEHDLLKALATTPPHHRGLHDWKKSVKCESCHAISVFDSTRIAQRCDFCGSPAIVAVDDMPGLITPESLLPVAIPSTRVRDSLRKWYGSRWFAPNKLKRIALTDTLHGIYLPYWTFDAHVDATWTALSGYHYYVNEPYRNSEGRTVYRRVRKTNWKSSSGSLSHFFDDDLVPGTVGVHLELLRKVEPFPTVKELKPYAPEYVRGWTVERYQVDLRQASTLSKNQMDQAIYRLCAKEVPGDTHQNLQVSSIYKGRTFKHILVPVWLASYTYGRKSFQVVINGYTGKIAGEHPWSWIKITFAILLTICALTLLFWLLG